ncbi:MAG: restriction endonuclease subunit S [Pseudomonas sp.]|uniref:restriction endonuclease subunit S n=1 Tax=Pseudomonas TaxID=286 RepID=UPI0014750E77|nr:MULTISPECIES: restriction endonuclease subunit S [Pseudomonas]MDO9331711.1 restriction endonuclease subunit S [Pseudomonas sp.]NMZ11026.1 restriction endonuclease subunit S [Pseudomonas proteolytica]
MTAQQLPEGWQMVKFGEIANHISKRVEPSETELDIYVGLEHLDPDSLKIKRHGVPSDVAGQKLLVKKGQIIFGKRRAYQRKVAVADWDCICSAHAMVLEANRDKVLPEFLPFFMQSNAFMNRAVAISEGSLSPTIKWKGLADQLFLIPDSDGQKSLVTVMKARLHAIGAVENAINDAKKLLETLLKDCVCNGVTERKSENLKVDGWSLKKLTDIASYQLGRAFPSTDYAGSGIKLLRPGNLYETGIVQWSDSDTTYLPEIYKTESVDYIVRGDEIVMNLTAQSLDDGFLGRACITQPGEECLLNQRLARISPKKGIDRKYLYWALQSRLAREYLHRVPVGTKVKHLYNSELENIPLFVPDCEDIQRGIAESMSGLANSISLLLEKRKKLMNLMFFDK